MVPSKLMVRQYWRNIGIRDRPQKNTGCNWAKGNRDTYRAGLLVYHIFCDSHNISKEDRSSDSPILTIVFISSCVALYACRTLVDYVFVVQDWHILHKLAWNMDDMQVKAALAGTAILATLTIRHPGLWSQ